MARVLLVEDDLDLAQRIRAWLEAERHVTDLTADGRTALEHLERLVYDVIILDWGLPDLSGPETCKIFRTRGGLTPIIMLTGRGQLADKEAGLDAGADDYLVKPFSVKELSARIRALLRRTPAAAQSVLTAGPLLLDPSTHLVRLNDKEVELKPTEFALLEFFIRNQGQLYSPESLLEHVWQADADSTVETVYTCVKRLRAKIDDGTEQSLIKTVYGLGYRFEI